nr:uncharacterized protein LOC129441077 isoform X1 [Misgurnus anguillicaudatus]
MEFSSFAKESREVNRRYSEESELTLPEETHWATEVRLPCSEGFESFHASLLNMDTNVTAGMVGRHNAANVSLTHKMLPRPSQLMGKRRRDQIFQRHTASVLQHIGDLRTRQRHINALKGDRWWGATETKVEQEVKEGRTEQHPGLTTDFFFTGCEQVLNLAPGGNPMMSFVEGTAHRSFTMTPACATANSGSSAEILIRRDYDEMLFQKIDFYH